MEESAHWLDRLLPRHLLAPGGIWQGGPAQAQRRVRRAAALLVDVQGFTLLTERHALDGMGGVERLGAMLRSLFGALELQVLGRGGDVQQFAGDSMLGLWFADEPAALPECINRALRAAQAMHEAAARFGAETPLTLRIGVAAGEVELLLLGGEAGRWLHCAAGDAVTGAFAAASQRGGAPTWCARAAFIAARGVPTWPVGDYVPVPSGPIEAPLGPLEPEVRGARVSPGVGLLVPGFVLDRLEQPDAHHTIELRQLSCVFARLVVADRSGAWQRLQDALPVVQRAVRRHDGAIVRLGADDRGPTVLAVWGVPGHRHEDDAARALAAADEIAGLLVGAGNRVPVGVGSGRGLAGFFGGTLRCEYTVHGPMVNRAAKLAAAAVEGVVCDEATRELAARPRRYEPTQMPHELPALAGRRDALVRLDGFLQASLRHEASAVLVEGPAGIGKSALVQAVRRRCPELGMRAWVGQAREPMSDSPYHVWRGLLPQLLELQRTAPLEAIRAAAQQRARTVGDAADWLPVLNDVMPLSLPETNATRDATDSGRADAVRRVLRALLLAAMEGAAAGLLVLEDVQWSDAMSWAMAVNLASTVPGLGLMATTRGRSVFADMRWPEAPHLDVLRLDPLARDEHDELVAATLQVDEIEAELGRWLYASSGGHPLYGRDLAFDLHANGRIEIRGGLAQLRRTDAGQGPPISAGADALIMARIDRLPPTERRALRLCSVLGDELIEPLPPELAAAVGSASGALPQMSSALHLGLVQTVAGSSGLRFEHALVREVAYASVPESERRQLHRSIARALEERHLDDDAAAEIAHHWVRAGDTAPALAACLRAGESALRRYANRDAISWLEQAGSMLAARSGAEDDAVHARCLRLLGHARANLGEPAAATQALVRTFIAPSRPWPQSAAATWIGIAGQLVRRVCGGGPLSKAAKPARGAVGDGLLSDAFAIVRLSESAYYNWDARGFLYAGLRGVNDAEADGEPSGLALWYVGLVGFAGALGWNAAAARYVGRGLGIAHDLGDLNVLARVHTFVAVGSAGQGRFALAFDHLDQAIEFAKRCSDARRLEDALMCQAVLHAQLGDDASARSAFEACRASSLERGDSQTLGWTWLGLAERQLAGGDCDAALELLDKAAAHCTDRLSAINSSGHRALAMSRSGDPDGALLSLRTCLTEARGLPTSFSVYAGLRSATQALVTLSRRASTPASANDARALRKLVGRFARAFAIGEPLQALLHGHLLQLEGRDLRAARQFKRAAVGAQRLSMHPEVTVAWQGVARCGSAEQREEAQTRLAEVPKAAVSGWII